MEDKTDRFLAESKLARVIRLDAHAIVHRGSMSPIDVAELQSEKSFEPAMHKGDIVELEIGGIVAARGRLVRKGRDVYFKVTESFPTISAKEESV